MARWTIIGAGDVAQRHVGPGLIAAGQELVAVWSPRRTQCEAVAARFGATAAHSLDAAIELADAVYVCTPVDCHADLALAAISQGRHVIVEKPMSLGLGNTSALQTALANRPDLAFRVAYYRRFWPLIRQLRRMIVAEELGPLQAVVIDFAQPYLPLASRPNWRFDPARAGGGIIADAGSHRLDYLVALLGWPESAKVSAVHRHGEAVETEAAITLRWTGGIDARMQLSWVNDARDTLMLNFANGTAQWSAADPGHLAITTNGRGSAIPLDVPPTPIEPMIRHFAGAMERSRDGINPLERSTVIAEAWRFDALLADLTSQAMADTSLALPS